MAYLTSSKVRSNKVFPGLCSLEPLQIVDTTLLANKFLLLRHFTPSFHLYDLDSSHNASAKIQKRFNTKTIFLRFSTIIQEKEK